MIMITLMITLMINHYHVQTPRNISTCTRARPPAGQGGTSLPSLSTQVNILFPSDFYHHFLICRPRLDPTGDSLPGPAPAGEGQGGAGDQDGLRGLRLCDGPHIRRPPPLVAGGDAVSRHVPHRPARCAGPPPPPLTQDRPGQDEGEAGDLNTRPVTPHFRCRTKMQFHYREEALPIFSELRREVLFPQVKASEEE